MAELTRRYVVMAMATDAPFDPKDSEGVFVLKPWKDPAAVRALQTYRDHCYPELARDLAAWIRVIESGPVVRGGIGRRNEPYAKASVGAGGDIGSAGARREPRTRTRRPAVGHARPATKRPKRRR